MKPTRLLGVTALLVAITVTASAEPPSPPPFYAITNVQVHTGSGKTVENATVLVADGLIEAVGSGITVPGDAWVVDGEGMHLFPGLMDGLTTVGQKSEDTTTGGGGMSGFPGRGSEPEIRGPEDRPATTTWLSAADRLGEDSRVEKWREAGFTTAVTAPDQGVFAGQAVVINLGTGTDPREQVVQTSVAQRVNFSSAGGFRSFPGSLMGTLAYIQQVFEDTRHYRQAGAIYADNPNGRERLARDRALEPLVAALEAKTPFLFPAQLPREIDRALRLAETYDLPVILYGAQGAYERIDRLAQARTPVLVSLNWPREEKDRDPDTDTPIRTHYHRRMAVTTPAELAAAGVPFAFYSENLVSTSEILDGVRKAVDAGLSHEAALTAMTLNAATIFGVSNRLGSIEKGKIANLVLASDWPWAEGTEVKAVFIDGRRFELDEDEGPSVPPAQDVSGTWELTMQSPGGAREMTAELEMSEDGKVTGDITSESGTTTVDDGKMAGELLTFETTRSMGGQTFTASWSLSVEGERLSGSASAGPMSMDVSGERTAMRAEVDTEGEDSTEPAVSTEELAAVVALYRNRVREMGTYAITNAQVWTVSGETIDNGTVVVEDGKIVAVGREVSIPGDAEVLDAQGGALIPGIIDAHSHIAIEGGVNEGTLAVTSMVKIKDVLNPDDVNIYQALAGGVTAANLLHGSANPIGGQNAVIKLRWGSDADGLIFEGAPEGIKFALGENPKRSNMGSFGIPPRYPQTRMGVMDVIRQAFTEAREYQKEWANYSSSGGEAPRRDLRLEALVEIMEGERLVHSHSYRADEILQLMRLAEEFGWRVATLQHVLEGYKIADEIAAHGAGASTFSDWWGYKVEAYDAIPHAAALMAERGVLVSINSDSGEEMRHLNQEAAKAVKWGGADPVVALAMVTLNPARQLRIDDRVGSIEVGKDADLVLYDGDPLSMRSVVQKTFVDGDLYFDREADRERQARIDEIKQRMSGKTEAGETGEVGDTPPPEVRWSEEHTYSCREVGR